MRERALKILLIEEDPSYALFIKNILVDDFNLSIFELVHAFTIEEAVKIILDVNFDVILLDIGESNHSNSDSYNDLLSARGDTKIIILTDLLTKDFAKQAVLEGASDYFVKNQIDENTLPLFILYATRKEQAEEALRKTQKKFELIMSNSSDIIKILDINGFINYSNLSVERHLGYKVEDVAGKSLFDFIHLDDKEKVSKLYKKIFQERDNSHSIEARFKNSVGEWRFIEMIGRSLIDDTGTPVCVLNSRDITERKRIEDELKKLSLTDELTGLHNRRGFLTLLHQQIKLAKRTKEKLHVLFGDVDGLKLINDLYGHKEGDNAIVQTANILKSNFRDVDIISRFGGDEFAVVLIQADETKFDIIINRLQQRINVSNSSIDKPYIISLSYGIVSLDPLIPCSLEEIIAQADKLMYENKKQKKLKKIISVVN